MKNLFSLLILILCFNVFAKNSDIEVLDIRDKEIKTEQYWILSKQVSPNYPKLAYKNDISGCVIFALTISKKGTPTDIELVSAEPNSIFVREAKDAVKRYRWKPSETNQARQPIRKYEMLVFLPKQTSKSPKCKSTNN